MAMAIVHSGDRDQVEEQRVVKDQEESDFDDVEDRYVISTTRYQSLEFVSSFSGRKKLLNNLFLFEGFLCLSLLLSFYYRFQRIGGRSINRPRAARRGKLISIR